MGRNVCLYDSWLDIELVDIGDHVMTSLNTIILSHAVYQNKFIQLRTVLKDNSITGGLSVVAPGTILEEGAILGACCSTHVGQVLKKNHIHLGSPAFKAIPMRGNASNGKKASTKEKSITKESQETKKSKDKASQNDTESGMKYGNKEEKEDKKEKDSKEVKEN